MSEFSRLEAVGERAVCRAGNVLRANVHAPSDADGQPNQRIADIKSSAVDTMRSTILQQFPDHSFVELGEDEPPRTPSASPRTASTSTWLATPLDGELNYARGLNLFAVSLALEIDQKVILGLIYDPVYDRCFVTRPGGGARCGGDKAQVSGTGILGNSLVSLENPPVDRQVVGSVSAATRGVRMMGSLSLAMALLAAGHCEVVFAREVDLNQAAVGILLVQEAGGVVTTLEGTPFDSQSTQFVATNGHLHDAFLRLVNGDR